MVFVEGPFGDFTVEGQRNAKHIGQRAFRPGALTGGHRGGHRDGEIVLEIVGLRIQQPGPGYTLMLETIRLLADCTSCMSMVTLVPSGTGSPRTTTLGWPIPPSTYSTTEMT